MKLTQKTDSKSSQQQTAMNGKAMEWCKNKVLKFVKKSFFLFSKNKKASWIRNQTLKTNRNCRRSQRAKVDAMLFRALYAWLERAFNSVLDFLGPSSTFKLW